MLKIAIAAFCFFLLLPAAFASPSLVLPGSEVIDQSLLHQADFSQFDSRSLEERQLGGLVTFLFEDGVVYQAMVAARYTLGAIFMMFFGFYAVRLITSRGESEKVDEFKRIVLYSLIGFFLVFAADPIIRALVYSSETGTFVITNTEAMKESLERATLSAKVAGSIIQYVLGGVALLFMGISCVRIVTALGDEEAVTAARKSLVWSTISLVLAGSLGLIIGALAPSPTPEVSVGEFGAGIITVAITENAAQLGVQPGTPYAQLTIAQQHEVQRLASQLLAQSATLTFVKYLQIFIGAGAVFMLFLAGAKIILGAEQTDVIENQRTMISWIFIGLGVIMLAEVFVSIFFPGLSGGAITAPGTREIASFAAQMGGLTNFLLTFSGIISVCALIVGAIFFSTAALNPEQAERGKKILLGAALGLIITFVAYALVNTVLSGSAGAGSSTITLPL